MEVNIGVRFAQATEQTENATPEPEIMTPPWENAINNNPTSSSAIRLQ
jgi:hypothetical protein